MSEQPQSVETLLDRWRSGQEEALGEIVEILYPELKRLARLHLRKERNDHTLAPTALVHEAYVRLVSQRNVAWEGRRHFLAIASRTMRRLLVEYARARGTRKRKAIYVSLRESQHPGSDLNVDVLALVQALEKLEEAGFEREAQVVQLRYLGGLTLDETAAELEIGVATVGRAWNFARAWLLRELSGSPPP